MHEEREGTLEGEKNRDETALKRNQNTYINKYVQYLSFVCLDLICSSVNIGHEYGQYDADCVKATFLFMFF